MRRGILHSHGPAIAPHDRVVLPANGQWQAVPACTGGQGTVAYEQYTQQSPGLGFRTVPQ